MKTFLSVLSFVIIANTASSQFFLSEVSQYNFATTHPGFVGQHGTKIFMQGRVERYQNDIYNRSEQNQQFSFGFEHEAKKIKSGFGLSVTELDFESADMDGEVFRLAYNYQFDLNDDIKLLPTLSLHSSSFTGIDDSEYSGLFYSTEYTSWLSGGLLLKTKKIVAGALIHNVTDIETDRMSYAGVFGISLPMNGKFKTYHSVIAQVNPEFQTFDLNNRVTYAEKWIVDISALFVSDDRVSVYPRLGAGFQWNDYLTIGTLLYSTLRNELDAEMITETYLEFRF